MKTLLAALLLSLSALAALPAAGAHMIDPIFPKCQTVYDFPDAGLVCVHPLQADCPVYTIQTTFIGSETRCVDPTPGAPASSSSAAAPPPCYDVYSRTDVGNYAIVRRDSCSLEVFECPYPGAPTNECRSLLTSAATTAAASPAPCYYIYSRTDVGNYAIVRRSSCAVPEVYECPSAGAPIEQCHHVTDGPLQPAAASSEPMCMYYYYEVSVGPVRYVQRDSCHSEFYVCGQDVKDLGVDPEALPDPAAVLQCAVSSLPPVA